MGVSIKEILFRDSFDDINISTQKLLIKKGIWLYYILVIFEGALRKWILPGLATPLLIVRDPIAIWLLYKAIRTGYMPKNILVTIVATVGVISIFTALLFGHGNIFVALFGARVFLLHFPLIFLIGKVFDRDDVLNVGNFTLWVSIPLAVIVALQFYSPQSSWINVGVGGDESGSGFSGALGYLRPSGVFSFTNGNTLFFSYLACFIFYFLINPGNVKWYLLVASTIGLLIVIPLSISRALLFSVGIAFAFCLVGVSRKPQYFKYIIGGIVGIIALLVILSQFGFFTTAIDVFSARFTSANEAEGGLNSVFLDRFLGGMIKSITDSSSIGFWGLGVGLGSNVGSMLIAGNQQFLLPEGEWGKLIGELGPLMGFTIIFVRIGLTMSLVGRSYFKLIAGDLLPWMLLSFGLLTISQGQWKQPTGLGFTVIIGGFMIACFNTRKKTVKKNLKELR